jgi:hypothetical protein
LVREGLTEHVERLTAELRERDGVIAANLQVLATCRWLRDMASAENRRLYDEVERLRAEVDRLRDPP